MRSLDHDQECKTIRVRAEAPAPMLRISQTRCRADGSANVPQNIAMRGIRVRLPAFVAVDSESRALKRMLEQADMT